jgi:hypothetical protein
MTLRDKNCLELQKPSEVGNPDGRSRSRVTLEFTLTFAGDRTKNIES